MKNKGRNFEAQFIKTINSGAFFQDGDAISQDKALEIKYTEKKSFRITTDLLEKIWGEALDNNKLPLFGIGIKQDNITWKLLITIVKEVK